MSAYLRTLLTPHASRWQPMLAALACLAAAAAGAVLARELWVASLLFTVLAFAAWAVGACAMVGFIKWLFASSLKDLKRD